MFPSNATAGYQGYQPDIKAFGTPDMMSCQPLAKYIFRTENALEKMHFFRMSDKGFIFSFVYVHFSGLQLHRLEPISKAIVRLFISWILKVEDIEIGSRFILQLYGNVTEMANQ